MFCPQARILLRRPGLARSRPGLAWLTGERLLLARLFGVFVGNFPNGTRCLLPELPRLHPCTIHLLPPAPIGGHLLTANADDKSARAACVTHMSHKYPTPTATPELTPLGGISR